MLLREVLPIATPSDSGPRRVEPGLVEEIAPGVRRLNAGNAGPTTFTGTNSYIVGETEVAVIDPGPLDEAHLGRLLAALAGTTVSHIVLTHTHLDHSALALRLSASTGAPICGHGAHVAARAGLIAPELSGGGDRETRIDRQIGHGERLAGPGWSLQAVHTPGHTANHLCYRLAGTGALFSGDHVMGWSTTMVAPPDGDMGSYLASLDALAAGGEHVFWPGHGAPIEDPGGRVRELAHHRRGREAAIADRLATSPASAEAIAPALYGELAPRLMRAATLTTLAHLINLADRGIAAATPPFGTQTPFRIAS